LALHQAEIWRDRLIADDDAVGQWITLCPSTDSQQLRALIRQARKDAKPEVPDEAPRHGRAYRDIFQIARHQLLADISLAGTKSPNDAPDGEGP
jgi:ribosome-associated protein